MPNRCRLSGSADDADRLLIFCDENAEVAGSRDGAPAPRSRIQGQPLDVLIGPEGGFADEERAALLKRSKVVRIALGPRILRADTAAVAALALVQAVLGDWRGIDVEPVPGAQKHSARVAHCDVGESFL